MIVDDYFPASRRSHALTASPMVFFFPFFIQAMKGRSNLKWSPHLALKNRRTFCVFR
jgi:hypothetical protein